MERPWLSGEPTFIAGSLSAVSFGAYKPKEALKFTHSSVGGSSSPIGRACGVAEKSIGSALRQIRERQGVSIVSVARRAGISDAMLSRIERGERQSPHFTTMVKISLALGVSLDVIAQEAGFTVATSGLALADAAGFDVPMSVNVDVAVRYLEKALSKLKATYPKSRRPL